MPSNVDKHIRGDSFFSDGSEDGFDQLVRETVVHGGSSTEGVDSDFLLEDLDDADSLIIQLGEYGEEQWKLENCEVNKRPFGPFGAIQQLPISATQARDAGLQCGGDTIVGYIVELVRNVFQENLRGKQARLTLWEFLEHFDIINDLMFICRIAWTLSSSSAIGDPTMGYTALLCLSGIWVTSVVAYSVRKHIIYHRIDPENLGLFTPFVVFWKIRQIGDTSPETLYMFEKLFWTYQLVMRVLEDIPQVVCSAIFLCTYGRDVYTFFMISWSCILLLLTSYRMGVMYPIFGTFSLLLSRQPPVDSPVLTEAANTTRLFPGYMAFTFATWCLFDTVCLKFTQGGWFLAFMILDIVLFLSSIFFTYYFIYLRNQAHNNIDSEAFRRLPSTVDVMIQLPTTSHPVCDRSK